MEKAAHEIQTHTVWRDRQHPPTFLRLAVLAGAGGTRMQQPHYLSPLGALMACIRRMFNYTVAVTLRSRTRVLLHLTVLFSLVSRLWAIRCCQL